MLYGEKFSVMMNFLRANQIDDSRWRRAVRSNLGKRRGRASMCRHEVWHINCKVSGDPSSCSVLNLDNNTS